MTDQVKKTNLECLFENATQITLNEQKASCMKKWGRIVEGNETISKKFGKVGNDWNKVVLAQLLENTEAGLRQHDLLPESSVLLAEANTSGSHVGDLGLAGGLKQGWAHNGPAMLGMVRRVLPKMMALDVVGVQPMSTHTGSVFALLPTRDGKNAYADATQANLAFHPDVENAHGTGNPEDLADVNVLTNNLDQFAPNATETELKLVVGTPASTATQLQVKYLRVDTGAFTGDLINTTGVRLFVYVSDADSAVLTMSAIHAGDANALAFFGSALEHLGYVDAGSKVTTAEQFVHLLMYTQKVAETNPAWELGGTAGAEASNGFLPGSNQQTEVSFIISKYAVEAQSRKVRAEFSNELSADMMSALGIDARAILDGIMQDAVVRDIDNDVLSVIMQQAQIGKSGRTLGVNVTTGAGVNTPGVFDMENANDIRNARWYGEAVKSLQVQIDREANEVGRQVGSGPANIIITTPNVASALASSIDMPTEGVLGFAQRFNFNTTASAFAGFLNKKYAVFIDQFSEVDYVCVGYKGASPLDAGIFYLPYQPLTPREAVNHANFQKAIGLETRYALGINPLVQSLGFNYTDGSTWLKDMSRGLKKNHYYRKFIVRNI